MYKKTILIFGLMTILLALATNATMDNALAFWSFDNATITGTNIEDIASYTYNGTIIGGALSVGGVNGSAIELNGSNEYVNISAFDSWVDDDHFYSCWVNPDDNSSEDSIITTRNMWVNMKGASGGLQINSFDANTGTGNVHYLQYYPIGQDVWTHIVAVRIADDSLEAWVNGVNVTGSMTAGTTSFGSTYALARIGADGLSAVNRFWDGGEDNCAVYDYIPTADNITELYNIGNPYGGAPPAPPGAINVFNEAPANGTILKNNQISINASVNSTYNFNISLYLNGTLNQSFTDQTNGSDINFIFNLTLPDNFYNYQLVAVDNSSNWDNSTVNNFSVDTIDFNSGLYPLNGTQFNGISLEFNASVNSTTDFNCSLLFEGITNQTKSYSSGNNVEINYTVDFTTYELELNYTFNCSNLYGTDISTNNTVFIDNIVPTMVTTFQNNTWFFRDNITGQFNFSDGLLLHSINVSIDNSEIFSNTSIGRTTYYYNLSKNISNLTSGDHNLSFVFADGHTAFELGGDYDIYNGLFNNYLEFDFWDGGYARIELPDPSIFDSFSAEKKTDRYTFDYRPNKENSEYTFEISSDETIHIAEKPNRYKGQWLIIGNHWMDFVLEDEPQSTVSIERIDNHNVEVTISNINNPDNLHFSSVGDLNIVAVSYNISTTTATLSSATTILEGQQQTISMLINKTGSILSTNATVTYNGTAKTLTKFNGSTYDNYSVSFTTPYISTASEDIVINWSYNITGEYNNETGYLTANQTILQLGIDNCSNFTTVAINMTMLTENNESTINSTLAGYFRLWIDQVNNFTEFNLTWNPGTVHQICIDPPNSTSQLYGQMEYQDFDQTFAKKTYYFINTTLNNQTQQLPLYLSPNTTQVSFFVTDQNDDAASGVFIKVLSYDLTTNSYKTTEIIKTDSDGEALGQIILNTQWYQFLLELNESIVLQTEPTKITTTTQRFRINLATDYFINYDVYRGTSTLLTYNNNTRTFSYTFSDPTNGVSQGCLKIIRRTINGDTTVNQSCLSSAAGTILLKHDELNGSRTFIGIGSIHVNPTFVTDTLSVSLGGDWETYGQTGVFMSLLIIVTLIMVGLWNPIVAVLLMTIGIVITNILGIFHLNWEILISFIIIAGITIYRLNRT